MEVRSYENGFYEERLNAETAWQYDWQEYYDSIMDDFIEIKCENEHMMSEWLWDRLEMSLADYLENTEDLSENFKSCLNAVLEDVDNENGFYAEWCKVYPADILDGVIYDKITTQLLNTLETRKYN